MDKDKINELLYNKSEILQKRRNRIFLFLFVFPLIYFLLDNSFITEVKTPLVSIEQTEIILLSFPIVYAILILIAIIQSDKVNEIEHYNLKVQSPELTEQVLDLLSPVFFVKELYNKSNSKGFFVYFSHIVIYAPILVFCLLFPIIFLAYIIYSNFNYHGDFRKIAVWSAILGVWIFISIIVKIITIINNNTK